MSARVRAPLLVLLMGLWLPLAAAQEPTLALPIGEPRRAATRADGPATLWFVAPAAGLLTVVVQAEGEGDLVLFLCDEEGQPLPDLLSDDGQPFPGGRSDRDLLGAKGVEALTLLLPGPGRYAAVVEVSGAAEARFMISAGFAPMPGLARPADPDGRPSGARAFGVGAQTLELDDAVAPREHDLRDWFAVRCERAGTLRVVLRAADGDLRLDAFAPGRLRAPLAASDDDEHGVPGNESLTLKVQEGQVVLVRVAAVFVAADRIPYRLMLAITP
ncbi:MAG: hypothetical protein M9894_24070 [Planctomycetes bacterium]|nr:hypothetical protein [Planctomycetota bacterium]